MVAGLEGAIPTGSGVNAGAELCGVGLGVVCASRVDSEACVIAIMVEGVADLTELLELGCQ